MLVFYLGGQLGSDKGDYLPGYMVSNNTLALHQQEIDLTAGAERSITACPEDLCHIKRNVTCVREDFQNDHSTFCKLIILFF